MDAEHHLPSLFDGSFRQRNVNRHLVTIKISIESSTYQRVNLNGTTTNEHWFECLNTKSVQGGSPVEQYRPLLDNLLQYVIYLWLSPFHQPPGTPNIMGKPLHYQPVHNKGFK